MTQATARIYIKKYSFSAYIILVSLRTWATLCIFKHSPTSQQYVRTCTHATGFNICPERANKMVEMKSSLCAHRQRVKWNDLIFTQLQVKGNPFFLRRQAKEQSLVTLYLNVSVFQCNYTSTE